MGFTTHNGYRSFRAYTESFLPSCVLVPNFNLIDSSGNVLDASLNVNKATRATSPVTLPSGLKVNYFDGTGAPITITQSASLNNLTAQTIICWIKPDADIVTTAKIFEKGLTTDDYISLSWITDGALVFYRQRETTSPTWTSPTAAAQVSTWSMCAVTYDSAATTNYPVFYKNGCAYSLGTQSAAPVGAISDDSAKDVFIGSRSAGTLPFKGYIGQFWEFNIGITPTQVRIIYNQTKWLYGI